MEIKWYISEIKVKEVNKLVRSRPSSSEILFHTFCRNSWSLTEEPLTSALYKTGCCFIASMIFNEILCESGGIVGTISSVENRSKKLIAVVNIENSIPCF